MTDGDRPMRAMIEDRLRYLGPVAIAVAFFIMAFLSWQTWPDILVDYGRELYVAWQLAEGRTLFSDIAYFNGPLSPYVNALWFRLFGESILTLSIANLLIAIAITVLLYRIIAFISSHVTASAACLVFVLVFVFGQLVRIGNYNYITPYSHEMTHGMLLALAAIGLLIRARGRRRLLLVIGAGLCLGLVFLTKPEIFLAAALALAVGLAGIIWLDRPAGSKALMMIAAFCIAAALPVVIAFALLATAMPAAEALYGVLGGWPAVFNGDLTGLRFYRISMGTDDPAGSAVRAAIALVCWALILGPAAWIAAALRCGRSACMGAVATVFITVFAVLLLLDVPWIDGFRPLPVLMLVAAIIAAFRLVKARTADDRGAGALGRFVMIVFAGALLAKIALFARLHHYGFALAMPALMMAIVVLFHAVPAWLERRGRCGGVLSVAVIAAVGAMTIEHVKIYVSFYNGKSHRVGGGPDLIWALPEPRSEELSGLLAGLRETMAPSATLAVLPEGVMVNFLLRRPNPTPYVNFMPPEFMIFGEAAMLDAFVASPPDVIAIIPKSTEEYGMGAFGLGYGEQLFQWIVEHYEATAQVGEAVVLEIKDAQPDAGEGE